MGEIGIWTCEIGLESSYTQATVIVDAAFRLISFIFFICTLKAFMTDRFLNEMGIQKDQLILLQPNKE